MELNKCSKCGGEAEHIKLWESKRSECFLRCKSCGRETKVYASKQGAVDAWNSGKLTKTDEDMIELLRNRALAGRMSVQDKQVMLEAADRIEKLSDDNAELQAIVDLRNKRKWYTKFVKEVFQKMPGNELSHPDFDYIYEQYFSLKNRLEVAQVMIHKLEGKLEKAEHDRDRYARKIEEVTAENEQWRQDWSNNQRQWEIAYDTQEDKVRAETVKKMQHLLWLEFSDCMEEETITVLSMRNSINEVAAELLESK